MKSKTSNENGMVLVMTMLVLLASTLIGVLALRTATTEVRIAGNEKRFYNRLYAAESMLDAAENSSLIWLDNPTGQNIPIKPDALVVNYSTLGLINSNDVPQITINYVDKRRAPAGTGYSVSALDAYYYTMTAKVNEQTIEVGVWKAVPRETK